MHTLSKFLVDRGLTLAGVGARVAQELALKEGEWLFASGSLVEGLGNALSDLDLYLISQDPYRIAQRTTTLALDVGGCLVDIEVYGQGELEELVERFANWAVQPRVVGNAFILKERERLHLHRVARAIHVWGDPARLERLRERLPLPLLARHKLDWAVAWINTLQVDLEGLRQEGDWETMLPVANDLLSYTVDALVAAYLETNPTPKWRLPLLRKLPTTWESGLPGLSTGRSALATVLEFYRTPPVIDGESLYARALSITAFSRRVLAWSEATLMGLGEPLPGAPPSDRVESGPPLGQLGLGVHLSYRNGCFQIFQLSKPEHAFSISTTLLGLLCLFDGVATEEDAHALLKRNASRELGAVRALIRFGSLSTQPLIEAGRVLALLSES